MSVTGAGVYPEYHVRAEHGTDYTAAPSIFRRMARVNPASREQGNYVVFRDVQPANGTLTLSVVNESNNPLDIDVTPALSGLQLVKVLPVLSALRQGNSVEISWNAAAAGYSLESATSLGGAIPADWAVVPGSANLTGSGSLAVPIG